MCAVSYWCTESRTLPKPGSISLCVFRCDLHLVDQAVGADLSQGAFFFLAGPLTVTPTSPFIHPGLLKSCQRCVGVCGVHRAASVPPRSAQQRTGRESRSSTVIGRTLQGALQQLPVRLCFSVLFQGLYKRFWVLIGRTLQAVR